MPNVLHPHDYDEWNHVKARAQYYTPAKRTSSMHRQKEIDTIEGRIQRKELIPVTGRTRVPRRGIGRIVVSLCGREVRVYHLSWSALSCECGEKHEKADFFVVNPNPNPRPNDNPYDDRPCLECGEVVEQIGVGRPRIVCAGECARLLNIKQTASRSSDERERERERAGRARARARSAARRATAHLRVGLHE